MSFLVVIYDKKAIVLAKLPDPGATALRPFSQGSMGCHFIVLRAE